MQWWDVASLVGVSATLLGLALTFRQARLARTAADATRLAIRDTEKLLARNSLLVLLPQLSLVEREIDLAVPRDDRAMLTYLMSVWKAHAGQLRGLLGDDSGADEMAMKRLQASVVLATDAKVRLDDGRTSVAATMKQVREAIGMVTSDGAALAARLTSSTGVQQ
jgi:hypothetical protein